MMWGLARPIGWLVGIGLIAMALWIGATHWRPSTVTYPLQGIDLPLDAGPAEWGAVRGAGADFAYLVATAGARARAPGFEANWTSLPEAGMRRGAVHLYSACEPAEAQANAFNVVVPPAADALPAAVDVELADDCPGQPEPAAVIAGLNRFIGIVEAHTGKPVLLRVSRSADRAWGLSTALHRPVWALGNLVPPRYPARPWQMWRASDWRRIDGIEGPVNWDVVAP